MRTTFLSPLLLSIASGAFMGGAWLLPGSTIAALLGWLSIISFVLALRRSNRPYCDMYIAGCVANTLGFYWLLRTISYFGGFGTLPAVAIFTFFVTASSVQFLLFVLFYRSMPKSIERYALGAAVAWCAAEVLSIRIFPWYAGHTQLGFSWFSQAADIGGALFLSFLLVWISEAFVRTVILREREKRLFIPFILLLFVLRYGAHRVAQFSNPMGIEQNVAVVQANVSIEEKRDMHLVAANAERYRALSAAIPGPRTLIIWPESVINDFINAHVASVLTDERLPKLESGNPLLIGALTYEDAERIFNSALGILNSGTVLHPYHKQILMPFGEFTPFGDYLPWLRDLNSTAANFTAGDSVRVFEYPMSLADDTLYSIRAAPLICYEDIVPRLSQEAVQNGADLLVNISNDAWFGETIEPYQHNLIASFRAIENRRYLVRSTNTGLTAIINPLGQTVSSLKPYSEGTLLAPVHLIRYTTLYTAYVGDTFGYLLAFFALAALLYNYAQRKRWIR